jgi:HlyD family secretion protein
MHPLSDSAAPDPGGAIKPAGTPRPQIVPPKAPRKRKTAFWVVFATAVVIAAAGAYYLNNKQASKNITGGGGIVAVPTIVIGTGNLDNTIRVNGTVAAQSFASLTAPRILGSRSALNRGGDSSFGRGGGGGGAGGGGNPGGGGPGGGPGGPGGDFTLVLMKLSNPGVRVKSGDIVAEFDPQNQAQRLDDYRDTVVQQDNNIKKSLANLASSKEAHDQQVRTAKAVWEQSKLDLKTASIKSEIDAEKLKLSAEEADATYKQLVAESDLVAESQRATIRASQLNQDQSKIEMKRAEDNVKKMTIKAPMGGIVVMASIVRNGTEFGQIREGDQVNAGQTFMTIVDPSSMVLNGTVNQVDAQRLRLGMKATLRLDAYPDLELPGSVIGIGAMSKTSTFRAAFVGEIPVRIKIEKGDPRLIPDLTGSGEIVLGSEKNTLVAPRSAVFDEEGGTYVYVQSPDGWIRRKVDLGATSFTTVAIKSGVGKGDVIAAQRPM